MHDLSLLKAVAQSPQESMQQLLSPRMGYQEEWIQSPLLRRVFRYMAQSVLSNIPVSLLSIITGTSMTVEEREWIKQQWKDARASEKVDLQNVVRAIKIEYMKRGANRAWEDYKGRVQETPDRVGSHIDKLGLDLSFISRDGISYDPSPSAHLADKDLEKRGTWGDVGIDRFFSERYDDVGGRPSYGFVIASCRTGEGKSTLGITLAAYALAYSQTDRVTIMSNELPRSMYSKGILKALRSIYQNQYDDTSLLGLMERLRVFGPGGEGGGMSVRSFETMRQILFWEKPQLAIMDSLNSLSAPQFANNNRYSENQGHAAKADALRDTALEYQTLLYAPGNMANQAQQELLKSPDKVASVMLFGSKTYENAADYSFIGWKDKIFPLHQNFKRCKNRHGTSTGELFPMIYDEAGGYYRSIGVN